MIYVGQTTRSTCHLGTRSSTVGYAERAAPDSEEANPRILPRYELSMLICRQVGSSGKSDCTSVTASVAAMLCAFPVLRLNLRSLACHPMDSCGSDWPHGMHSAWQT